MAKKKKKFDYRNLILLVFSTLFAFGICEVFLRIMFATDQRFLSDQYQSNEYLMPLPYWKIWHYPNNETVHGRDCFESTYETNEFGIKGPAMEEGKPRIALLGDSFVEGYGCSNNQLVSYYMDSLLNDNYELLNLGTSGGFGTVHQLAQYENFVHYLKPDITILFFLNYNDLYDNVQAIQEGLLTDDLAFSYPTVSSYEEIEAVLAKPVKVPESMNDNEGLLTMKLLDKGGRWMMAYMQMAVNSKFSFRTAIAEMYGPKESETIKKGYQIVEKSLARLKKLTDQDSSKLLLINIADPFQIDDGWLSLSGTRIGQELDAEYPNKRVEAICNKLGIEYFSLYKGAKQYIQEKGLGYPYLSFECNRHYSPEGNHMMAQLVAEYLENNKLVE